MDLTFLFLLLVILTVGLIMLFSASYVYAYTHYGNNYFFIAKQATFAVVGVGIMLFVSRIDYHQLRRFAIPFYIAIVILLVVMLILPPMVSGTTVKRWFSVGPINFQPSELGKFAVILLLSHLIAANQQLMKKFTFGILFLGGLVGLVCVLVVLEPHLSATVLIFLIGAVMMIVGGIQLRWILGGLGVVAAAVVVLLSGVIEYAQDRITYWLNPWAAPVGEGYQTIQSLLSIGSGGLLGRGLGQSRQKYLWVPEPHNDFIFAIVCEELGLIGALIIIALFAFLMWRGFVIAIKAPDKFGSMLALGLTFQVGLQMALNVLVVTNTIPNTGISLPFFSYGGTSLLILLFEMGIILSVSRSSKTKAKL
ncbi:MAG: putative lipid II flippase FtsW [Ruminococcaceae bacterium]|nr:putative lipid II flippase FtsW [Oscillospiraceae bacterium]